jgi:hypothetical protein
LFLGSKKIAGGRMSLQHGRSKSSSKQGFEVFGCHVPQALISLAKLYIRANKDWCPDTFSLEKHYTTILAIAHDRIENLANRDKNGVILAIALEELLECLVKTSKVKMSESMNYSGLIQRLKEGSPKKKRSVARCSPTPTKKRQKNLLSDYEEECDILSQENASQEDTSQENDKSLYSENEKVSLMDDNSDYEFESDENDDVNERDDVDVVSIPPKVVKPVLEKEVHTGKTEDSDSDSFDPVNDEEISGYDPHGAILPSIRRIVVKGANKCYYGVGPKPVATLDTKGKSKMARNTPSPGDIGNIKSCIYLNLNINDNYIFRILQADSSQHTSSLY